MSRRHLPTGRARAATAAGVAVLVGVGALAATNGEAILEQVRGEHSNESLQEFVKEHPRLNVHSGAIAFAREKLEQQGGEGSGELLSGPAQEQYDARAIPRTTIAPAQSDGARSAFVKASRNGKVASPGTPTPVGQQAPAANGAWSMAGPTLGTVPGDVTYTGTDAHVAGRTTAMAIDPTCTATACTLYIASAGGGVWKSVDATSSTPTWTSIGAQIPSGAIGDLYVAPDHSLYVGTGEESGSSDSEAGVGLYRSTNQGASFSKVPTMFAGKDFALDRSIGAIAVDPKKRDHLYVGTDVARHGASSVNGGRFTPPGVSPVGLYESIDGGTTWTLSKSETADEVATGSANGGDFFRGGVTKILTDPINPTTVYASMSSYGLYRRVDGGAWTRIYTVASPGSSTISSVNRVEFDVIKNGGRTRIYLGDATAIGGVAGLFRSDDARAASPVFSGLSSADPTSLGFDSYNFCQAQCSYDMVVTAVPDHPDEVVLSGSMNYGELFTAHQPSNGRAVVRSTDKGVSFTDMTNDRAAEPNGLHPDHHALVFVPGSDGQMFFSGSDGGIVKASGPFVDDSAKCAGRGLTAAEETRCRRLLSAVPTSNQDINTGLNTLQFQSVSLGKGGILQGGTQDNGTWESDLTGFSESVGGDGGNSGFNVADPNIRYHSYYAPQHDVNFRGADTRGWDWISDPLLNSGEAASFYTPFVADPKVAGTVFDGLQHIWRTTDNGGDRAYLDLHCNEFTGDFAKNKPCGDWVPMGGSKGDLSGQAWGTDNVGRGNYVVAITRAPSDTGTLWAATRRGRLFVSTNADATSAESVKFTRLDQSAKLPVRFVSGIAVDPKDANHAFVSYSGYSAYAAGGHVYEVRFNPTTNTVSAQDLSGETGNGGLGDQPITGIAYDSMMGTVFASTDFGVLALGANRGVWTGTGTGTGSATGDLPVVATYGLTYDQGSRTLYAATHGRGVWQLKLT